MNALIPAAAGGLTAAGILGIITSLRPVPVETATAPRRTPVVVRRLRAIRPRTRALALIGVAAGVVVGVVSGWLIAVVAIPLAVLGVPTLLKQPRQNAEIDRLEAMAEWTRNLAGVLTVGVGLEQSLIATLRSAPAPIGPEISRLVARLRARWTTEDALQVFADELDDSTGDLVAAYLILGARRRGAGLASVLQGLAESVADEVAGRRQIEADRATPRATSRNVTLITLGVLALLAFDGPFMAPYATPLGQALLAVLLAAYTGTLVWMRRMSIGEPLPRFLTTPSSNEPETGTATL